MTVRGELLYTAKGHETTVDVEAPRFTIGRGDDNVLCLGEPMVSRYHAEIIRIGEDYLFRDHGSTNGSYVNGSRVAEQILSDNDVVRVGKGGPELLFRRFESADAASSAAHTVRGPTEALIDSLSSRLATMTAGSDEQANVRCILADAYLKKGDVESAAQAMAPFVEPSAVAGLDAQIQAAVSLRVGNIAVDLKHYDGAVLALRQAAELFSAGADHTGFAEANVALGRALIGTGDLFGARDSLQRSLLAARRAGNELVAARAHLSLGKIDWKEADLEGARYNWMRASRLAEQTSDPLLEAQVQLQEAFVLQSEGKLEESVVGYQMVVAALEKLGNVRLLLKAYSTLSRVLVRQGAWLATERLLTPRLELARAHKLAKAEAVALTDEAELRLLQGQVERASSVIAHAVALHGDTVYARTQRILGRTLAASHMARRAADEFKKGLAAAKARGALEEQILIGLELALVYVDLSDLDAARRRLEEAESITSLDPALGLMARALYTRGTILAAAGQINEANRCFTQSLSIFQTMGDPYRLALSHAALGALRYHLGRHASARAHLEEARDLFTRLGAATELSRVKERLAATVLLDVKPAMTNQLVGTTSRRSMNTTLGHAPGEGDGDAENAQPYRVLLAASNEPLALVLKRGLEVENYVVERVEHGRSALESSIARTSSYNILLLDALLEHKSGFDVCRELRRHEIDVPIILLGSRQSVEDKIDALHVGADDYLCQTNIVLEELLAKMEALLR